MKYSINYTTKFKKQLKRIKKQGKDLNKLYELIEKLANGNELERKYKNHNLIKNKLYKNCKECHIEPDWLLIYQIESKDLILLLISTGNHNDLFDK